MERNSIKLAQILQDLGSVGVYENQAVIGEVIAWWLRHHKAVSYQLYLAPCSPKYTKVSHSIEVQNKRLVIRAVDQSGEVGPEYTTRENRDGWYLIPMADVLAREEAVNREVARWLRK